MLCNSCAEKLFILYNHNCQTRLDLFYEMLKCHDYHTNETVLGYITESRLEILKEKFISGENNFSLTFILINECLQPLKNQKIIPAIESTYNSLKPNYSLFNFIR